MTPRKTSGRVAGGPDGTGTVAEVLQPCGPQLLFGHPFFEHAIESPAYVEEPLLDAPPRRALGGGALVLVLEMVVVPDERLELFPRREF